MIRNILSILILILVAAGLFILLQDGVPGTDEPERLYSVEYHDDGETLQVLDQDESEVTRYTISEFNAWTEENWDDVFEERPSFGEMREVAFTDFHRFDRGASVSPGSDRLAFSVSDYAAASSISFIAILHIDSGDIELVGSSKSGDVDSILWSSDGEYVAYVLNTARSHGDGLSVDNTRTMTETFSLAGEDIVSALDREDDLDPLQFMPQFDELVWVDEATLQFTSASHVDDDRVQWSIEADGSDMRQLDIDDDTTDEENGAVNDQNEERSAGAYDGCVITGCSSHVCAEEDTVTTCEWMESYACYETAVCERDESGECGWREDAELLSCLEESSNGPSA